MGPVILLILTRNPQNSIGNYLGPCIWVQGFGFKGLELKVLGFETKRFRVQGFGFKGLGLRVLGFGVTGFRVKGFGDWG